VKLELEKGFSKALSKKINVYSFQVGVLEDKPHFLPAFGPSSKNAKSTKPPIGTYAGGPVRKIFRGGKSKKSNGEILQANMQRLGKNILLEPFLKKDSAMMKFVAAFLKTALAKSSPKRVQNLLQAVVRNPILRLEYGTNKPNTVKRKGFNRHLFDTGQMFKSIKAKVKRRG
jgi:hypothetical protein